MFSSAVVRNSENVLKWNYSCFCLDSSSCCRSFRCQVYSRFLLLTGFWIYPNVFLIMRVLCFLCRQVYKDGLLNQIETRHSVSLCLLFCPVGIVSHCVTKALTTNQCKWTGDLGLSSFFLTAYKDLEWWFHFTFN